MQQSDDLLLTYPATPHQWKPALSAQYPERVIDTGTSEQHCMSLSIGLALAGRPVVMSLSAWFLARCYDQLYDALHHNAPLIVLLGEVGLSTIGPTHNPAACTAAMKALPNMTLMHPLNTKELELMLDWALASKRPVFIESDAEPLSVAAMPPVEFGKGCVVSEGDRLTVVPIAGLFRAAHWLAETIDGVEIINPRFLKPLDVDLIVSSVRKTGRLLVMEKGYVKGGVGEELLAHLQENRIPCKATIAGAGDEYQKHGTVEEIYEDAGISKPALLKRARQLFTQDWVATMNTSKGKVVIVTGGNSGIGRAAALLFAREGAKVVIGAHNEATGEETVREIKAAGGEAIFVPTDVSSASDVEAMVGSTVAAWATPEPVPMVRARAGCAS